MKQNESDVGNEKERDKARDKMLMFVVFALKTIFLHTAFTNRKVTS